MRAADYGWIMLALGLAPACSQSTGPDEAQTKSPAVLQSDGDDDDDDNDCDSLEDQLARLRAATERYRDVDVAIADGFIPTEVCVSHPMFGTMGNHFVNPARLQDPLSLEEPEVLVYIAEGDSYRLVSVEYLLPILVEGEPYLGCGVEDNSCPPPIQAITPSLFRGIGFDGPMAGHEPGMPWHFDQHVWLYEENPDGLFAPFNPALTCPGDCEEDTDGGGHD